MGCSVREAQKRISSAEFAEWIAFENIDPDPSESVVVPTAILACMYHNVHRPRASSALTIEDLLPHMKRIEKEPQTPEEMKCLLKGFARMHNAVIRPKVKLKQ